MIWPIIITAIGLLFVIEGILPSLSPSLWKRVMQQMLMQGDYTIRVIGFVSMLIGLALVSFAHDLF